MPGRRQVRKGSFGGHFDELVQHFPEEAAPTQTNPHRRSRELQEKLDIHALLFERAWDFDRGGGRSD